MADRSGGAGDVTAGVVATLAIGGAAKAALGLMADGVFAQRLSHALANVEVGDELALLAGLTQTAAWIADALATLQREEFGIDAGKAFGFDMAVTLRIQVEALAER